MNKISGDDFSINLIPHTLENTTLKSLSEGSTVNLEVDQIARYVERMTQWSTEDTSTLNQIKKDNQASPEMQGQ